MVPRGGTGKPLGVQGGRAQIGCVLVASATGRLEGVDLAVWRHSVTTQGAHCCLRTGRSDAVALEVRSHQQHSRGAMQGSSLWTGVCLVTYYWQVVELS